MNRTIIIVAGAGAVVALGVVAIRRFSPGNVVRELGDGVLDTIKKIGDETRVEGRKGLEAILGSDAVQGTGRTTIAAIGGAYCGPQCAQAAGGAWDLTEPLRRQSHKVTSKAASAAWKQMKRIGGLF